MSTESTATLPRIATRDTWLTARTALLEKEKAATRLRDAISAERRELPMVKVDRDYVFEGPNGRETLADLFAGRSQLMVKHFMFGPDWEEPCIGCSFEVDHIGGALVHLEHHDVSYVAISRAPFAKIEDARRRMGWSFKWVSSHGSDFNYDFGVSFTPEQAASGRVMYNFVEQPFESEEMSGESVFYRDEAGDVYHTYSTYGRGAEELIGTYIVLDLMPKGRNETGPSGDLSDWVRLHDRYDEAPAASGCCCGSASGPA
ncbi:MAG TPA: thioredoxin family protein [Longimicrobium sp.]|nr:thioredoxin family protein [Longimicrobium sp.]